MKALKTTNLSVGYKTRVVVANICLEIERGQIISVIGANGSGKSTILRTFAGLLRPIYGVVSILGRRLENYKQNELPKIVGVMLTEKLTTSLLTVFEIVSTGRYPHTDFTGKLTATDISHIESCIRLVKAEGIRDRYFEELSDGEKQKTLLARALAQDPQILILDEPTGHLDINHRMELLYILHKLSREKKITVIMSLHEIDLASKVSDKLILVNSGEVVAFGTPEEVIDEQSVNNLYSLEHGRFSSVLGNVEMINHKEDARVFTVAGSGTGSSFFRALSRKGIGVVTGVLHENDIDFVVAKSIGIECVSCKPFDEIENNLIEAAKDRLKKVDYAIDSGFPIGKANEKNIQLIKYAVLEKKEVLSFRKPEDNLIIFGSLAAKIKLFDSITKLIDSIDIRAN